MLNRDFWIYRCGQFLSAIGDACGSMALVWWVLDFSGSASILIELFIPSLVVRIIAPFLMGSLADKVERKWLAAIGTTISALGSIGLLYLFLSGITSLPLITVSYLISTLGVTLFSVSAAGILVNIVPSEQFGEALRQSQLISGVATIAGGVLSGALIYQFGIAAAFAVDITTFIIAIVSLTMIQAPTLENGTRKSPHSHIGWLRGFLEDIVESINLIRFSTKIQSILLLSLVANFVFAPLPVIIPVLVKIESNLPAWYLGLLESMVSIGIISSSLMLVSINRYWSKTQLLPISFLIMSIAYLCLSIPSYYGAIVSFAVLGIGVGFASMLISELIAYAVTDEFRCRFSSLTVTFQGCARVCALMLSGFGIDSEGCYTILLLMGVSLLVFSGLILLLPEIKFKQTLE
ncbi:hypothetical protein BTO01_20305 [Vibrio jasicida]|uniref:MFS transporter n=1 Tax=Vibrio jasicida TaxID=766224 RepID=UPI000CF49B4D|nr:MFS transporter [Vibrio jasicida]PQJ59185.1 hypothetical protein BTO01_20305 [Vibrio jasicida]